MTTLIAAYNSDGCIGRCDAKCYNATEPECNWRQNESRRGSIESN